jgi:glycosyltransferase involved in cell wall biosynthesis
MIVGVDVRELQRSVRTGIGRMVEAIIREASNVFPDTRLVLFADSSTRLELASTSGDYRVLAQPFTLWFDQIALPRAIARSHVDVFWSPYYKSPLYSNCPTVITIHDVLFLKHGGRRLKNALFKPWARLIGSRASAILTDSRHSKQDLVSLLGFDDALIEVVPLGVSERFTPQEGLNAPETLKRIGLTEDYILTVTNFRPHKNDEFLIRAYARLAKNVEATALVLAGKKNREAENLHQTAVRLGVGDRVFMPGMLSDEDLPALYAGARLFAFPSLYEGFGLPLLEAMASGTPVLSSSASSLPEVAGDAAMMRAPTDVEAWADSMHALLTDDALRQRYIQAGLERASTFTWRQSVSKLMETLSRVAKEAP